MAGTAPRACSLAFLLVRANYLREMTEVVLMGFVIAGLFSVDSLVSLPWVQSLPGKGPGTRSAMVLLVAGAGTTVSTLGPVSRLMGRQTAILDGASVVILAALCGLTLNMAVA